MKHAFLPEEGTLYKANLHCHSTLSDGKLTPRQLKEAYQKRGYSILSITDHEALFSHEDLNDENFLTINGVERAVDSEVLPGQSYDYVRTCHLNFFAKNPENTVFVGYNPDYANKGMGWRKDEELQKQLKFDKPLRAPYSAEGINEIIRLANQNGFLVMVNHLCWSEEEYEQFSQYKGMFATEIYNHGCYVEGFDEQNGAFYDMLLRKGNRIFCMATDDNHNRYPFDNPQNDSFGGFVMIKAKELTYEAVIAALEQGAFYASTGPLIDALYLENGKICIDVEGAKRISLTTDNRHTQVRWAGEGESLTHAEFDTERINEYFRIEVTDAQGKRAYTNAYFRDTWA